MYEITEYSKLQAKKLGVEIKHSSNKKKKLDVFKNNKKVAQIGAKNMMDYGLYKKEKGKAFADERRRLFRKRTDWCKDKTGCFYSREILW
jgi:hypothetical protein